MVIMLPTRGYRKPAPTEARMSRMGRVNPLGAPADMQQPHVQEVKFHILAGHAGQLPAHTVSTGAGKYGEDGAVLLNHHH